MGFADVVKVTDPKTERLSRRGQSMTWAKCFKSGKGRRVGAEGEVKEIRSMRGTHTSIAGIEEEGGHGTGNEGNF